jgi:hypothetical protein
MVGAAAIKAILTNFALASNPFRVVKPTRMRPGARFRQD